MEINWRAVFTGFLVALTLGLIVSWLFPPSGTTAFANVVPGLVGGFVAGYMVEGLRSGGVHGGLATSVGGIVTLVALVVADLLTASLTVTVASFLVGVVVLLGQAIPGALAGGFGGWARRRRATREVSATETR